jgi:hypothetical protein
MNKEIILEEISQKHNKADAFISLFFAAVDVICYLLVLIILGCGFKNFFSPKQMITHILLIDVMYRIYSIYNNTFEYSIINEVFLSLFSTIQFYLFNSILKILFKDEYYDGNESIEIKYPLLFSIIFYPLCFTFDISKALGIFQYLLSIICILAYSYYIQTRISLYVKNFVKKQIAFSEPNLVNNLPYVIAGYFIIFFAIKIMTLFVQDKLYFSYLMMACDIFKEVGKYLTVGLLIIIVKLFNKGFKEEENDAPVVKREGDLYF